MINKGNARCYVITLTYGKNPLRIGLMFEDIKDEAERYEAMRAAWPKFREKCFELCERDRRRGEEPRLP